MMQASKSERHRFLTKLRNEGNHRHNNSVLKQCKGDLVVAYRPKKEVSPDTYVPCPNCKLWVVRTDLWKHNRTCKLKKDNSRASVKIASNLKALPKPTSVLFQSVLAGMKVDDISLIIRNDELLCALGERLTHKHGREASKHAYIRSRLRELGRLLQVMRSKDRQCTSMAEFICPTKFSIILAASKDICGYNEETLSYKTPSLALKLSRNIAMCVEVVRATALEKEDDPVIRKCAAVLDLISLRWPLEVAVNARRTIDENNKSKVSLVPLTEDVKKLSAYLKEQIEKSCNLLKEGNDIHMHYSNLQKATLALLILFNRKRSGEASRITLHDYQKKMNGGDAVESDVIGLSKTEAVLASKLWRMEITGKKSRIVPLLLTETMTSAVDILLHHRGAVGVPSQNIYIFASLSTLQHIRGCDVLREVSTKCGAASPELLRSTRLRKQIATLSQVLNLKDNELDSLAQFMGHDIRVHRDFYRVPDHTVQLAKISKLLMAMDKNGGIKEYQGKNLDEIDIPLEDEIDG